MKNYRKRIAAIAALIGIIAVSTSQAFDTEVVDYSPGPGPATGWLAQTDIFYGYVGPVGPTYWGWTFARYSRSGYNLNLEKLSDGTHVSLGYQIVDSATAYASYLLAEEYWLDSSWTWARSCVFTTVGDFVEADAELFD
jgi:hypothetical protein